MRGAVLAVLAFCLVCPVGARAAEEDHPPPKSSPDQAPAQPAFVLEPRIIELPLYRLNEVLKKQPVELAQARMDSGAKFLHAVVGAEEARSLELRLASFGSVRRFPAVQVKSGEKTGATVTGQREVTVGSDPTLHPKRGVVFTLRTGTVRLSGMSLTALCEDTPEGIRTELGLDLLDNITATGPGGDRTAPIVVTRSIAVSELTPEGGAVALIPPLAWNQATEELNPKVQVVLVSVRRVRPDELLLDR